MVELCSCGVAWIEHVIQPLKGAEINRVPTKPPLEVLTPDLQQLLDGSSVGLTPRQKARLEQLLKIHHDVFATDNFTTI